MSQEFADASLIVFGHGSTVNEQSGASVLQHVAELRRREVFKEVREAFWKQEPSLETVIGSTRSARVFLAPLFISDGYFSEQVIPAALGFRENEPGAFNRVLRRPEQTFFYCRAVGSHPRMSDVVLDRARQVVSQFPFPAAPRPVETTIIIVGHGTQKDRNSRAAIDLQVERARERKLYAEVQAVFLEEDPRLGECYRLCPTRNMIVVPFFISDGMHVQEDIPVLLGEPERIVRQRLESGTPPWRNPTEKHGKLVWYSQPVGTDPSMAEVILERVRETVGSEAIAPVQKTETQKII